LPGTLPALEDAVAQAEAAPSGEAAANALQPAEAEAAVTLPTALRWVRRRVAIVRATLTTVRGLFRTLLAPCQLTVRSFRAALGTASVLVALRGICARYLHTLPAPLGLRPPPAGARRRGWAYQQRMGKDPPEPPA
jgi:hypothetical protein